MIKAALWYHKKGYAIIPLHEIKYPDEEYEKNPKKKKEKTPYIKWDEFKTGQIKPTEAEIRQWWQKWPKATIGLITGIANKISVLDFDTYKLNDLQYEALTGQFPGFNDINTPTADTPRKGRHFYFKYHAEIPQGQDIYPTVDGRNNGGYIVLPPSAVYENGNQSGIKYQWQKGRSIVDCEFSTIPEEWLARIKKYYKNIYNSSLSTNYIYSTKTANNVPDAIKNRLRFEEGTRDDTLFHIANTLLKGGMPEAEVEQMLVILASKVCNPPFPTKEALTKVKSAIQRTERKNLNIMQEVRDFIAVTESNFRVTDLLQAVTNSNKVPISNKAVLMALNRLSKQKVIERMPAPGTYRIIEQVDHVNIKNVKKTTPTKVCLPFGFDRFVNIYPGNMIILAGVTNGGKSALIFNMILQNMDKWPCWYFSTEINKETVKTRVDKYNGDVDWDFEIVDNWNQHPDGLQPDALNFCDWVDSGEEAYHVCAKLSRIQEKMRNGVVVVAIQKNPGLEYGIGGAQTASKASLYLTIDKVDPKDQTQGQYLRVVKAKGYDEINPSQFVCEFKIVQGINLIETRIWGPEEEDDKYSYFKK